MAAGATAERDTGRTILVETTRLLDRGAWCAAARLLERSAGLLWASGVTATLLRTLERLPATELSGRPLLLALKAALVMQRDPRAAEVLLDRAAHRGGVPALVGAVRAQILLREPVVDRRRLASALAAARHGRRNGASNGIEPWLRLSAADALARSGRGRDALALYADLADTAGWRGPHGAATIGTRLAAASVLWGSLDEAARTARRGIAALRGSRGHDAEAGAVLHCVLGEVAWTRGDLAASSSHYDAAERLAATGREAAHRIAFGRARLAYSRGDAKAAAAGLARAAAYGGPAGPRIVELHARALLRAGDFRGADRLLASWGDRGEAPVELARARLDLAAGRVAEARRRAGGLHARLRDLDRYTALGCASTACLAVCASGGSGLAQPVCALLALAERDLARQPILDEGPELLALLPPAPPRHGFLTAVLDLAHQRGLLPDHAAALTPRETAVLRLLTTHLTRKEIARDLGVSENTVRFHVKAVYARLGVGDRSSAVERARDLGLL